MTPNLSPHNAFRVLLSTALLCAPAYVNIAHAQQPAEAQPAPSGDEAQRDARAQAAALFEQALPLMESKQYAQACSKLEQAAALADGEGILYKLAVCHEHIGRTASAHQGFLTVAERMREAGQAEREKDARSRATALQPKLTRVRITVAEPVEGMSVQLGQRAIAPDQWGADFAVDPGQYEIRVDAPQRQSWTTKLDAREAGVVLAVQIPELAPLPQPAPAPVPVPVPPTPSTPTIVADVSAANWQTPVGIAGMAVGGATIIAASALGIAAKIKADGADCDSNNFCSDPGLDQRADAVVMGNVATGVTVAGAVLGAAGFVVWITAPDDGPAAESEPAESVRLRVRANGEAARLDLMLRW